MITIHEPNSRSRLIQIHHFALRTRHSRSTRQLHLYVRLHLIDGTFMGARAVGGARSIAILSRDVHRVRRCGQRLIRRHTC